MLNTNRSFSILMALACFLLAMGLSYIFRGKDRSPEAAVQLVENRVSEHLENLEEEAAKILEELKKKQRFRFSNIQPARYSFYIYKKGRLFYWSDYRFVPRYRFLEGEDTLKLVKSLRKDFLSRKWTIEDSDLEVFGIIPLHNKYKIDNNYVQSGYNEEIFRSQEIEIHDLNSEKGYKVCASDGQCLFKIEFGHTFTGSNILMNSLIVVLYFIGGLLLFLQVLKIASSLKMEAGLLILILLLVLVRAVMLSFGFPGNYLDMSLFDSRQFASSSINPSFGDLYLNTLCLLLVSVYVFRHWHRSVLFRGILRATNKIKRAGGIVLAFLLFAAFHYQFTIFETIYLNSQVTYDINQTIRFNDERVMVFLIFITNTAIVFLLFHVFYRMLQALSRDKKLFWGNFLIGLVAFGAIKLIFDNHFLVTIAVVVLLFIILSLTRLPLSVSRLRYSTFLYVFTAVLASSLLGTLAIYEFEHKRDRDSKFKYANQFLIENDNLAEYLLDEANEKIRKDIFIQTRLASPFLSKDIVKSKIRQVYLSNYFDKYDIQINLYNANKQPLEDAPENMVPEEIRYTLKDYRTSYPDIYFVNKFSISAPKRYYDFIEIRKRGVVVGYVVMDLSLKRIIPDNVYPELLVDNRFLFPYQNSNYSYAIFNGGDIIYHSGDFNYLIDFDKDLLKNEDLYQKGVLANQYRHIAVRDQRGRVVVISSNNHPFSDIISNFSFLFLIQVLVTLILSGAYALYFSFQKVSLNYSARIQLYLNIAFFLPLFAVSITTLSLINSSFRNELNEEYYRKAEDISNNISDKLDYFVNNIRADQEELPNQLAEISKYAGVDVNLFSVWGRLLATSQPLIYENDLLSTFINPVAYAKIREQGENAYITKESVGELQYNTTFYGVKSSDTGKLIGILSIPFFQSENTLEESQIVVLTNVINIFSMIFIIFLLLSFLAAKWLTFPLVFITQKLKKTTLTGFNEPLVWTTDDEIGLMVGEYNRMLVNLEESKKALARSEKETAWREIAQQVAHEIKNPLTPMKLTLQHLSRRLQGKDGELEKPINNLLQQIDTLSDIASSFSSFAKMPIPENEVYEFGAVVRNITDLHRSRENVAIHVHLPDHSMYTLGDEQLMGRIISNIIINAIQAGTGDTLEIEMELTDIQQSRLLLEIRDNGPGIDEEIHSKIFIPNFSTKETGSGIGLAIAKHGVEHAGGKIWFETEKGKGTSFYIELPLISTF